MMSIAHARQAAIILILFGLSTATALAAEPNGCAAFKWPVDRERASLTASDRMQSASGQTLDALPNRTIVLSLKPAADASLPKPPERSSAPGRFAGFIRIKQVSEAGTYTVALSTAAWVDAVQGDQPLKPSGFRGATNCDGVRKLVRYQLSAGELLLQISGVSAETIALTIMPVE
ncbi:hypothetical protein DNX69_04225 [Rhodopseudomonas palustris]|uniref:Uncharacterized protein n=1 Tax=Rhodopseudomonas palustris TaxID=1076 RepID=A0A323UNA9_RHOPL|nr:hypothetical protein [Rhodopseudomonas palustris]PZA13573.1 hypothetical protein DNX69_04225 [Rhodopseudomonas palustris]